MPNKNKVAILVAGMHRSGTSMVSRLLGLLGCDLPKNLIATTHFSAPSGILWEPERIVLLNEKILASAGSHWDDWTPFDPRWRKSPIGDGFLEQAQIALEEEFGNSRLFVLKDPRICRLMPFWIEVLRTFGAEPRVAIRLRTPVEVALSLGFVLKTLYQV